MFWSTVCQYRYATAVTDYGIPVPSQLVFDVEATSLCTNISTTDDGIYEESESFVVSMSSTSTSVSVSGSTATVLITNNDGLLPIIQWSFYCLTL